MDYLDGFLELGEVGKFTRLRTSEGFEHFSKRKQSTPRSSSHLTTMESANASAEALKRQIEATEAELSKLRAQLAQVEAGCATQSTSNLSINAPPGFVAQDAEKKWPLLPEEYKRYGRQMIVPSIGIKGILSLCFYVYYLAWHLGLSFSFCLFMKANSVSKPQKYSSSAPAA